MSPGSQAQFTTRIEGGVGFGKFINDTKVFLNQVDLPRKFLEVATLLENKAMIHEIYSGQFSSVDLNILWPNLMGCLIKSY